MSYAHGLIIYSPIDSGIANWNITSFLFLVTLLFVFNRELKFLYFFYYIALLFSIYIVFSEIFILFSFLTDTSIGTIIWDHIQNNSDFIMVGFRSVFGIPHPCLYYRSASICIIPECVSLLLLIKTQQKKYLLHFILFFLELFISGARANMIAAIMILFSCFFAYNFYKKKRIIFSYVLILLTISVAIFLLLSVVTEKEHSNLTKMGHMDSFYQLFNTNPIRFLFIGSGPGTIMYSLGTHRDMAITELSYFELIKNYGFLPSFIMIQFFLLPVMYLYLSNVENIIKFVFTIAYASFFFVAGTNPLFIGSTGFTIIICMFYVCDKNIYLEFNCITIKHNKRDLLQRILRIINGSRYD